ncbi:MULTISPECIES: septum formation inhibitor Maf [unclassified Campylobacter]|uniref:septum formation inhibitor Maf n=1 Tax=unclassified Campylobacter TaxID=2593542 RepID=UPI003D3488B2
MIVLASSSQTRAKILTEASIDFRQISFDYDESLDAKDLSPSAYVLAVVNSKKKQFLNAYADIFDVLFADSCVVCDGKILGKPKDKDDARRLLDIQSENSASVVTGMIFYSKKFELINVSCTTYKFAKFDETEVDNYIASGLCMDKAGAMMVEGFNKRYIISQVGNTSTARGLNVEILKAFL